MFRVKQQFRELLRHTAINLLLIASQQIYGERCTVLGTVDKTLNDIESLPSKYCFK